MVSVCTNDVQKCVFIPRLHYKRPYFKNIYSSNHSSIDALRVSIAERGVVRKGVFCLLESAVRLGWERGNNDIFHLFTSYSNNA